MPTGGLINSLDLLIFFNKLSNEIQKLIFNAKNKKIPRMSAPGIGPGPTLWKSAILTTILRGRIHILLTIKIHFLITRPKRA